MPRFNQRGLAHILVILILLVGIIAGVYLVKHPQIFKPRAYDTNSIIYLNQSDDPPPMITSTNQGAQSLLEEAAKTAGYSVKINQADDEITLEFNPSELDEEQAKIILQNSDKYYLRTLMWLLYDPFNAIEGPPIDAWYALCDHLDPGLLAKIGADETYLKAEEGQDAKKLECTDPPPILDQFNPTDSHLHFTYKKIPATVLVNMVETIKLQRENKDLSENAKDIAFLMVPVLGPVINATRNPGLDPLEITKATVIDGLATIILGPVGGKVSQIGGKALTVIGSRINARFIIPNFRKIPSYEYADFQTEMAVARQRLTGRESLVVKILGEVTRRDRIIKNIVVRMVGTKIGPAVFQRVFADFDVIYSRMSAWELQQVLPVGQIKRAITKHQNNFVNLLEDDYNALLGQGSVGVTIGQKVSLKSKVVIKTGHLNTRTSPHEFVHYSQFIHHPNLKAYVSNMDRAEQILWEGLNDWVLQRELGYPASYNNVVSEVETMVQTFNRAGVDGVKMARPAALNGNTREFMAAYEKYTGDFNARARLTDLFNYWRVRGLIPPIFLLGSNEELDNEDDGIIEDETLDIPSGSNIPPRLDNFLNCSYSQEDSNCSTGSTVCTGHTDDNQCSDKKPEDCFNIVRCQYDSSRGSSCNCSQ